MNIDILTLQQWERASIEWDSTSQPITGTSWRERERKMCRLVMVASGMWMRQNGNDEEQICEERSSS
jgi:hypothetical protein